MRQTTLTLSRAPGRVICWTNFFLDFVEIFNISPDLSTIYFILVGVEFPWCIVVTLSWNAITCFLESSWVQDRFVSLLLLDNRKLKFQWTGNGTEV